MTSMKDTDSYDDPQDPIEDAGDGDAVDRTQIRKIELIDRVVSETGLKKRDVKPVVETMLSVMSETLQEGRALNLPPMGKIKLQSQKDLENGAKVLTLKLRLSKSASAALAEDDAED